MITKKQNCCGPHDLGRVFEENVILKNITAHKVNDLFITRSSQPSIARWTVAILPANLPPNMPPIKAPEKVIAATDQSTCPEKMKNVAAVEKTEKAQLRFELRRGSLTEGLSQ